MILAAAMLIGCGTSDSDPHRKSVRQYLSENLDDPNIEEVRWWPAKPIPEYRDGLIAQWDESAKTAKPNMVKTYEGLRDKAKAAPPPTMARMKYRSKSAAGSPVLIDQIFVFDEKGKVESVIDQDSKGNVASDMWEDRDVIFRQ